MPDSTAIKPPKDRNEMLSAFVPLGGMCAEIGVLKGQYSDEILKRKPVRLFLIDPWKSQDAAVYGDINNHDQVTFDEIYNDVRDRFKHDDSVKLMRMYSHEAALLFANESLDFVYLDGNHGFSYVLADCFSYLAKIKNGGWLCGHDYTTPVGYQGFYGVRQAVGEFCKITGYKLDFVTEEDYGSWGIRIRR